MFRTLSGHWRRVGRRRLGFAGMLAAATSVVVVVTSTTLTWMLTTRASEELSRVAIQRGSALVEQLSAESELGVLAGDRAALAASCNDVVGRDDVASCAIMDARGRLLASAGEVLPGWDERGDRAVAGGLVVSDAPGGHLWQIVAPVLTEDRSRAREELQFDPVGGERRPIGEKVAIGRVVIGLSRASVDASQRRLWMLASTLGTLIVLLGVAGAVLLARYIVRPMRRLVEMTHAIAEGRLDASVDVDSDDEIGTLAASFNRMAASLRESRARLFDQNRRLEASVRARTRQLEEMNDELRAASELKSEFLATVSHELRTPLNVIIGYSEILHDTVADRLEPEQRSMLEAIERYTRLQLDLVTDVLDFSRLSSGRVALDVKRFALEPALADVAALHGETFARMHLHFRLDVDPAVAEVETDRVKVQEIVRNLLDNAVKFTDHGGIEIVARPGRDPALLVIEVRDSGAGIASDDLPTIFDEFRQVGQSSTRSTGGVGLGLAIVRRLCEVLGGSVRVESELGRGSTFVVEIARDLAVPVAQSA